MDEKTTAEPFAHPTASGAAVTGPGGRRRRRVVAAAALLLALTATVSACDKNQNHAGSGASTAAASASAAPSASGSGSPAPGASAQSPGGASGSPSGGVQPGGPSKPNPPTGGPTPAPSTPGTPSVAPGNPPAMLKPVSYLTSGNQLTVFFFGGICDKYGLKTDQSRPGQVGVQIVITQKAPAGQMCPALQKKQTAATDLAQPLNGRMVVDTDSGASVPLESLPNGGPVSAGN
ncbi:hypothetical protein ACIGXM_17540 [Kitasatospora sp. NPDC052896]|uniref:hypothetical protein n=1 Tax=Kitasatospora sp. NPDC052896 TaxID=3364061 RepID=UPI0037C7B873